MLNFPTKSKGVTSHAYGGNKHVTLKQYYNRNSNRPLAHRGNAANLGGKTNEIFSSGN